MIESRIVKIVMLGSLALFAGLVTFDNLTDYQTNYAFVRHVLSMDATPPGSALMYRSISSPSLWEAAYALIIAGEGATALGFAGAAALLLRHLRSPAASLGAIRATPAGGRADKEADLCTELLHVRAHRSRDIPERRAVYPLCRRFVINHPSAAIAGSVSSSRRVC